MAKNKEKIDQLSAHFRERCGEIFGAYIWQQVEKTFVERLVTFRINTLKAVRVEVLTCLQQLGFKLKRVSWYTDAFILVNKSQRELEETDLYTQGKIYVQSLASMVPPLALAPLPGEKVLDLTAAPGGKTSQLAALMNNNGELVANDNNPIRFEKLKHNMELLGVKCKTVLEHGAEITKKYPEYFDKILLDAPCGAEARIILSDRRTYGFWNERGIKENAFWQRQLLFAAWSALKKGGVLVYSTCTFAPEENEVQVSKFLDDCPEAKAEEIKIEGLQRVEPVLEWKGKILNKHVKKSLRLMPTGEVEGFFVTKITKSV